MKKTGIIFNGLKVRQKQRQICEEPEENAIREENAYEVKEKEVCLDVTYFLTFAVVHNPVCKGKMKQFSVLQILHYQKLFEASKYHGEYFLSCLGYEEYYYAQIVLGMLFEIREGEKKEAKKSYESLIEMITAGWCEVREELFERPSVKFHKIQEWAGLYTEQPAMGLSQLCIVYLLAEVFQVKILPDTNSALLFQCMLDRNAIWNSPKAEVMEYPFQNAKAEQKSMEFSRILRKQMKYPYRAITGFLNKKEEEFDYYLQNLFHLGGIDRNVIYGEKIDKQTFEILTELGGFENEQSLKEYVYSLYIVLLSQYVSKCLNYLKVQNPAVWETKRMEMQDREEILLKKIAELEKRS